jgi:hypothetical protein
MKRLAMALSMILCCILAAQDTLSPAMERLAKTERFAFGGVGIAGVTSPGEKDFRVIVSQPPEIALDRFEKLYATGNAQAQAYALAGIRKLDPKRFKQLLGSVKNSNKPIVTMAGCIVDRQTFGAVAREIESGHYDLWIERGNETR